MKAPIALIVAAIVLSASGEQTRAADPPRQCSDPNKLKGLCALVANQLEDKRRNTPFQYKYEALVYGAARVSYEDDDSTVARGISLLFRSSKSQLIC